MKKYLALLALGVLAFASTPAQAEFLEWKLDHEFSGSGATLEGGFVYVKLESTVTGTVVLTLDTYEIPDNSKFIGLYLNVDPAFESVLGWDITFDATGVSPAPVNMDYSANAYKADGDGFFDVAIEWSPDPGSFLPPNSNVTITMTGVGLDAPDFDFLSYYSDGSEGLLNAARVRSLNDPDYPTQPNTEGSGWFTGNGNGEVPEASTLIMFGSGLSGLLFFVRKKGLIKF